MELLTVLKKITIKMQEREREREREREPAMHHINKLLKKIHKKY